MSISISGVDSIISKLRQIFVKLPYIDFGYMFGSRACEAHASYSDIDIAVYVSRSISPNMDTELEIHSVLSRGLRVNDVDLIIINNCRNILLLRKIVENGVLILDRNPAGREKFEIDAIHACMDFKYQRMLFLGR